MKVTWLGHASLKLESGAKLLYIDPYAGDETAYTPADVILISQWHFDHCSMNLVRKASNDTTQVLGTPEVAAQVFPSSILHVNEHRILDGVEVIGMPTKQEHVDMRGHDEQVSTIGFLVNMDKKTLYYMADSCFVQGTENLKPDVLVIPVGGTYTQGPQEAAATAKLLSPKLAIPVHWGSIVGSRDDAELFKEMVEREGITVKVLNPGESIDV